MRYVANITLTQTVAGIYPEFIFRANGMFDPQFSLGGHQPRGFDQIMGTPLVPLLYEHYTVLASSCECHFNNTNAATTGLATIRLSSSPIVSAKYVDILEGRYVTWKQMPPTGTGNGGTVLKALKFTPNGFLGIKNPKSNTAIRGSVSADPATEAYFIISTGAQDELVSIGATNITVVLDYTAYFTEPITPPES